MNIQKTILCILSLLLISAVAFTQDHNGAYNYLRLFRYGPSEKERPAVILPDGKRLDVSAFGEDYDEKFFGSDGIARLTKWLASHKSECQEVPAGSRIAACVVRPSKILGIGLNYVRHARESGQPVPKEPIIFFKANSSLAGPYDTLVLPRNSLKTDWEVELGVVIGRKASYVSEDSAMNYVAGFTIVNDISERAYQLESTGQWTKGKSFDGFAPVGPYIIAAKDAGNVQRLNLWLKVNGVLLQNSNTSDMVFNVPQIISYVSRYMTLLPGDIIATGTPQGVGLGLKPQKYLKAGDVMELGIDRLGTQKQHVIDPPATLLQK